MRLTLLKGLSLFCTLNLIIFYAHCHDNVNGPNQHNLDQSHDKKDIYIGGLFPIKSIGWDAGGILPAVEMALDDINNRSDILQSYKLNLLWKDTQVLFIRLFKLKYRNINLVTCHL